MTDRIETALTPEQWAGFAARGNPYEGHPGQSGSTLPATVLALANAALPDDDPRKITRKTVAMLRNAAGERSVWASTDEGEWEIDATSPDEDALNHLADVLESYLPPE